MYKRSKLYATSAVKSHDLIVRKTIMSFFEWVATMLFYEIVTALVESRFKSVRAALQVKNHVSL